MKLVGLPRELKQRLATFLTPKCAAHLSRTCKSMHDGMHLQRFSTHALQRLSCSIPVSEDNVDPLRYYPLQIKPILCRRIQSLELHLQWADSRILPLLGARPAKLWVVAHSATEEAPSFADGRVLVEVIPAAQGTTTVVRCPPPRENETLFLYFTPARARYGTLRFRSLRVDTYLFDDAEHNFTRVFSALGMPERPVDARYRGVLRAATQAVPQNPEIAAAIQSFGIPCRSSSLKALEEVLHELARIDAYPDTTQPPPRRPGGDAFMDIFGIGDVHVLLGLQGRRRGNRRGDEDGPEDDEPAPPRRPRRRRGNDDGPQAAPPPLGRRRRRRYDGNMVPPPALMRPDDPPAGPGDEEPIGALHDLLIPQAPFGPPGLDAFGVNNRDNRFQNLVIQGAEELRQQMEGNGERRRGRHVLAVAVRRRGDGDRAVVMPVRADIRRVRRRAEDLLVPAPPRRAPAAERPQRRAAAEAMERIHEQQQEQVAAREPRRRAPVAPDLSRHFQEVQEEEVPRPAREPRAPAPPRRVVPAPLAEENIGMLERFMGFLNVRRRRREEEQDTEEARPRRRARHH